MKLTSFRPLRAVVALALAGLVPAMTRADIIQVVARCSMFTTATAVAGPGDSLIDTDNFGPILGAPGPSSCDGQLTSSASMSTSSASGVAQSQASLHFSATHPLISMDGSVSLMAATTSSQPGWPDASARTGFGLNMRYVFQVTEQSMLELNAGLGRSEPGIGPLILTFRDITSSVLNLFFLDSIGSGHALFDLSPGRTYEFEIVGGYSGGASTGIFPGQSFSGDAFWFLSADLNPPPVPLPAAVWLLISAMGPMGWSLARRSRRASLISGNRVSA